MIGKAHWILTVPKRLNALAERASKEACYTTKAEFVRAAVKKLIATLEPLSEEDFDDITWNINVNPELDELVEKAIKTGSFQNKSEFIRYAVRRAIKVQIPKSKL